MHIHSGDEGSARLSWRSSTPGQERGDLRTAASICSLQSAVHVAAVASILTGNCTEASRSRVNEASPLSQPQRPPILSTPLF